MENVAGLSEGVGFWSERRVFVTGATGMVGSWLVRRLVELNAYVVALVRDSDPQAELFRSGTINRVNVVTGALEDYGALDRAVNEHEVDTVFHLAAQAVAPAAHRSPRLTFESNIQGSWNLLEVCRTHRDRIERIVVASSDKAYGFDNVLPYRETMPLLTGHPYEVSKTCVDLITQSYHLSYGLPVAITRFCNIFGGGDLNWSRLVPGTIRSLICGTQPVIRSDGAFVREYLFLEDAVDAYLLLAENAGRPEVAGQAFNFGTEDPLTVRQLYEAICETVGVSVEPLVLGQAQNEIRDQRLSSAKAHGILGWKPEHDLASGLGRTLEWYRNYLVHPAGLMV